jgi:hypothetical protein
LKTADPGLDISTISDGPIRRDDGDVADLHIFDAGIWGRSAPRYQAEHVSRVWRTFEILSEASDCHAVASVTGSISDVDIVRSRLDRNTIIPALVDEILQPNVVHVHRVCNPHQQRFRQPMGKSQVSPKPSVFCTQFTPNGAFTAVALQEMPLKCMFVPFMMFKDHNCGSLT